MPYNGKILGRANARLADIRERNKAEHERRVSEVYRRIPEIESIDENLKSQMVTLMRLSVSRSENAAEEIARLKQANLDLQVRRAECLVEHSYPRDWLDFLYACPDCRDTGTTASGAVCHCLDALYNKELTKELSTLLRSGSESFEGFDLSLYPETYSDYYGCIPREYMRKVYAFCKSYAENFPKDAENLLLQGEPGLGKTYLSACIARVVAEKGYSLCYDSAVSAFSAFETQQFSRGTPEAEDAAKKVDHMLKCDLMILDDLGTEVVTPLVLSSLYTLINTRAVNGRFTIINTTLYPDQFAERYNPSIASRLNGFYKLVSFAGDDIRAVMKGRK